jgi:hypothetical protein
MSHVQLIQCVNGCRLAAAHLCVIYPNNIAVCSLYFLQYVVSSPFHSICRKMLSFGFYRSVSTCILPALKLADKTCIFVFTEVAYINLWIIRVLISIYLLDLLRKD